MPTALRPSSADVSPRGVEALRIVHQVVARGAAPEVAYVSLLEGLAGLVEADAGVLAHDPHVSAMTAPELWATWRLPTPDATELLSAWSPSSGAPDPMALRLREDFSAADVFTRCRRDLVDDTTWYASRYYEQTRRSLGLDSSIYSLLLIPSGVLCLTLYRRCGERELTAADRDLVSLFHFYCGSLFLRELSPFRRRRGSLSPREQEVLDELLEGAANKDIAAALGLSLNTVEKYVKRILRTFEVSSRAELVARWFSPPATDWVRPTPT